MPVSDMTWALRPPFCLVGLAMFEEMDVFNMVKEG